jgi:hypothetical protein
MRRIGTILTKHLIFTLMHMQREKGRVAMMSRIETRARRRAQQPGPSGSAAQ